MYRIGFLLLTFCCCGTGWHAAFAGDSKSSVIIYDGVVGEAVAPREESKDLWVTLGDLKRATQFELKPQGVCTDKLCFPLPEARKSDFVTEKTGVTWFNLSAFARLLKQPVARDVKNGIWYFGPRPEIQNGFLATLEAPSFTLPDIADKMHSLADYRGKKVLLITWASW
jgi:hypothetical protein